MAKPKASLCIQYSTAYCVLMQYWIDGPTGRDIARVQVSVQECMQYVATPKTIQPDTYARKKHRAMAAEGWLA